MSSDATTCTANTVPLSGLTIDPMKEGDLLAVLKLEGECFSAPWPERSFLYALCDPLVNALSARLGSEVVGYVIFGWRASEYLIANLAVSPMRRRRGIGRKLLEAAIRVAEADKAGWVVLDVRESNSAAIGLYRSFGFRVQGRRMDYYSSPVENSLIMRKDLGQ